MSEQFIATAQVQVLPNTAGFSALLVAEVNAAILKAEKLIKPITVPVLAGGAAAAATLATAQKTATTSTLNLASAQQIENAALGRGAVVLDVATAATYRKAGADVAAAGAARNHAVAESQLGKAAIANTAGMLGLRGAVLTAGGAFIAATVAFQALGKAVGSAVSFERELNVFQVTAGATADQMVRVQVVARELGRDITLPGVAANDAAQTLSLLARAGLSVEDSLNAVRGTLQLATAAEIENAAAAELVANALNSFKLDGTAASRVADLLAGAANQSQGSITDMGLALKQTSAIASGLGISIEDTITILTQLSRAGLSASDAGTSFRQTLLRLIQDLPKVQKEVASLGLNLRDTAGNIRPEVFEELGKKLKTLTPAARQLAIANLGGADAIRTLLVLTRAQAGEFDNVQRAVTQAGLAQEFAAARTEGLGGDVEGAKNQFADLGLTIGKVSSGPLSLFVRTAGAAAGAMNALVASVEGTEGGQGFFSAFGDVIDGLSDSFAKMNFNFQTGVRIAALGRKEFSALEGVLLGAAGAADALGAAIKGAAAAANANQADPASGLNVEGVLNRVKGFDDKEVRARISGDNNTLLTVLAEEQAFLQEQLDRQFVKNRPALRRSLEQSLLSTVTDIASIQKQGAAATKAASSDIEQARNKAEQAFITGMEKALKPSERLALRADRTESLKDDIKFQKQIIAILEAKKDAVLKVLGNTAAARQIVSDIQDRILEEAGQLKTDQANFRKQLHDALAERIERIRAGIELDIELADINENTRKRISLRERLIQNLLKERKKLKLTGNALKENRNEIARINQEIEDITGETKQTGNAFKELTFQFLQTQQGFAANLLGNLIPGGMTGGLVGNVSTAGAGARGLGVPQFNEDPTRGLDKESKVAAGRDQGVSSGQGSTQIQLLRAILRSLQALNGRTQHPEARYNRDIGRSTMDTFGV